jgi:hypothetical protein
MQLVDREISIDMLYFIRIPLDDLLERRLGALAEGAVKVRELDERDGSVRRTGDRHGNADDWRRLEIDADRGLRPERRHEDRPPNGDLLLAQVRPDILASGRLVATQAALVRLIVRLHFLISDRLGLLSHLRVQ